MTAATAPWAEREDGLGALLHPPDPEATAILLPPATGNGDDLGASLTYRELQALVTSLTRQPPFSHLSQGQALSFLLPNSLEFVCVFFALAARRAIASPLNPAYRQAELTFYLRDVQARGVLVLAGQYEHLDVLQQVAGDLGIPVYLLDPWMLPGKGASSGLQVRHAAPALPVPPVHPSAPFLPTAVAQGPPQSKDPVLFLHTSGTTGTPKGVPLSNENLLTSVRNIIATYHLGPADRTYLVMPLFHVHGLIGALLSTLASGGSVCLPPKFSATRFWRDFLQAQCTWYTAVPTIHQMLLAHKDQHYPGHSGSLRFIRSCSSSLAPSTLEQLERAFGRPVIEAYAMSEAAHQMTSNYLPEDGARKAGSVGRGRGVQVCVLDERGQPVPQGAVGEVCIAGRNVIQGYHNNEAATRTAFHPNPPASVSDPSYRSSTGRGWFRTGDLGSLDADGFLHLHGRIKEQINRGGEKISPQEVDRVFLAMPGVAEAVAFAIPSPLWGEEVGMAVVLRAGYLPDGTGGQGAAQRAVVVEQMLEQARRELAPFKVPRAVFLAPSLPKTATGKVQRRVVAAHFVGDVAAASASAPGTGRPPPAKL